MNYSHKILSCSCAFLLSLQVPASGDFQHTPGKSPVIVLQGEVTIDGQQRPDLGRSFADTISGGLLKTKAYSVIDHLGNQTLAQAIENSTHLAPEQSAVSIGKETGARYIFVPRMIVEGDFQKLTLKKIRVSDGQVVDVFETHAAGSDRANMFVLIGDSLKYLYKETPRSPSRLGKTSTGQPVRITPPELDPSPIKGKFEKKNGVPAQGAEVASADIGHVPESLDVEPKPLAHDAKPPKAPAPPTIPQAEEGDLDQPKIKVEAKADADEDAATAADNTPEPKKILDPATELEDLVAVRKGTVSTINPEWRFCILKLSDQDLQVGDELSIKTGKIVPNEVTVTITKIEDRQAVADLEDRVDLSELKTGQSVYQWQPR